MKDFLLANAKDVEFQPDKLSTGIEVLDRLLNGGLEKDVITTIYGPAGSGKSNICLIAAANAAKEEKPSQPQGNQVIYIDTEGGFSIERLKQITDNDLSALNNIVILQPTTFEEQKNVFMKLNGLISDRVKLIIVDTISMLYRLELGKSEDVYLINRELGRQISHLTEITRKKHIPVMITNQVYANFDERDKVNMVGGDIIKYGSKCLIELQIAKGFRVASLRKHRSIPEG
ncbi:MAG: DNA repair and recombination protein RadB, partial [Nanoarchaeota archaeon]|nr:DNA repair and recombination protein RadB [Nanoarchaeota archaeon]